MKNIRKLLSLILLLVTLSAPALAGDMETPPAPAAPQPTPAAAAPATTKGDMETPPLAALVGALLSGPLGLANIF